MLYDEFGKPVTISEEMPYGDLVSCLREAVERDLEEQEQKAAALFPPTLYDERGNTVSAGRRFKVVMSPIVCSVRLKDDAHG